MNREGEVKRLRGAGMSYGKIAAALKMSKRDVSRILSGTTVPTPDGTLADPLSEVSGTNTVPVPSGTNPLPRFVRYLSSAIEQAEAGMQTGGVAPWAIEQYLKPLRKVVADWQAECPEAVQSLTEKLAAMRRPGAVPHGVDPLTAIDPLALL